MKPNYFEQKQADIDDIQLQMAIHQGYVQKGCLLGGGIVMGVISKGEDPCKGCICSRVKCGGRPERGYDEVYDDESLATF